MPYNQMPQGVCEVGLSDTNLINNNGYRGKKEKESSSGVAVKGL